ncbi:hypothetical protein, partial [Paraburkholderia caribensis]|uniref:hypothetical protein n=1 Tax=Paraburkholderia caribensis TaxID=75105 RepID=UPI00286C5A86
MWFFPGFRVLFSVARPVWFFAVCAGVCELFFAFAGIRALLAWFRRGRSVYWAFALVLCAGIRDALSSFRRRPCAGRHLLFFAAAKKS